MGQEEAQEEGATRDGGEDRGREESASQVVSGKELELHQRKMTRGTKRREPRACEYSGLPLAVNLVLALVAAA